MDFFAAMPIKLKCTCGQVLSVPDALAGKAAKCPKCQTAIRIPAAGAAGAAPGGSSGSQPGAPQTASVAKSATKSPATAGAKSAPRAQAPVSAPVDPGMDELFDEIGLVKKTGPTCPKCGHAIQRNAALCTNCGFNFQTGEQAKGFKAKVEEEEFDNMFLREAASNMRHDIVTQERLNKVGMPWWMLVSFLLGAICIGLAGIIIVDATFNEPEPQGTFLGELQREKFGVVIGVTLAAVGGLIAFFAHMSIAVFAFFKSAGLGFATLLIPFYALYYGIKTWADNKSGIYGLVVGGIVAGFGLWLNHYSGGVQGYYY